MILADAFAAFFFDRLEAFGLFHEQPQHQQWDHEQAHRAVHPAPVEVQGIDDEYGQQRLQGDQAQNVHQADVFGPFFIRRFFADGDGPHVGDRTKDSQRVKRHEYVEVAAPEDHSQGREAHQQHQHQDGKFPSDAVGETIQQKNEEGRDEINAFERGKARGRDLEFIQQIGQGSGLDGGKILIHQGDEAHENDQIDQITAAARFVNCFAGGGVFNGAHFSPSLWGD